MYCGIARFAGRRQSLSLGANIDYFSLLGMGVYMGWNSEQGNRNPKSFLGTSLGYPDHEFTSINITDRICFLLDAPLLA
jgi:hypothetical protein